MGIVLISLGFPVIANALRRCQVNFDRNLDPIIQVICNYHDDHGSEIFDTGVTPLESLSMGKNPT